MKSNLALIALCLGLFLTVAPFGARAQVVTIPGTHQFSVVNSGSGTTFKANTTGINGTVEYNLLGTGGNDTFILAAGNGSMHFLASGLGSNTFILNSTGFGNSTFSLASGANSSFVIREGNVNGSASTQAFIITGGSMCVLNESSPGPVSNAIWSVALGTNSTVNMGSTFAGNVTSINILT